MLLALFPSSAERLQAWWTPILALEFAQTPEDVAFLAGPDAAPLRAAMDAGHRLDMLFPFLYAGLLALTAARHHPGLQGTRCRVALVALVLAALAVPADLWENTLLFKVTALLEAGDSPSDPLQWLPTATWVKWLAIGASTGLLAFLEWPTHRTLAAACALCAVVTGIAFSTGLPIACEAMAGAVSIAFLGLSLRAIRQLLPHRPRTESASPQT